MLPNYIEKIYLFYSYLSVSWVAACKAVGHVREYTCDSAMLVDQLLCSLINSYLVNSTHVSYLTG